MRRFCLVAVALVACAPQVRADRIAPIALPVERALRVPVVVVGKVTAVEKGTVDAPLYPGATNKVAHKVAVVKVETNLYGAANTTHLKVGFVPAGAGGRRGPENPELAEGQQWLFFLTKLPGGEFYTIPYLTPPVDAKAPTYKADVEAVTKVAATLADPVKALKAEKAADRFSAAVALVLHYRTPREGGAEPALEAIPRAESQLILKALAEGDWKPDPAGGRLNGLTAFYTLGLSEKDGWKQPVAQPGADFVALTRDAFAKWVAGPGAEYQIKKYVPKKANK